MRKLTTYWYVLRKSISEPDYYFTLRSTKIFFSVQFFILSLFLIALFEIPNWSFRLLPIVVNDVRQETTAISTQVPEDAVFTYADGKLSTNGLTLPTTLTASQHAQDLGLQKNLISITAEEKPTNAALTFTPTKVMYETPDSPASETSYTDIFGDESGSLSRDQIRNGVFTFLDAIEQYRLQIASALALGGFFASLLSGTFTILLYSILVQVIGWVLGVRITYKFAIRWGLHIFPIALAIQEISSLLASTGSFPILTVSYIAIATLILWTGRSERPTIIFK